MGQWQYKDWSYQPQPNETNKVDLSQSASGKRFTESPDNGGYLKAATNAVLINQAGEGLELILTDVTVPFSASGKTLQSRTVREFLFRAFSPVSLAVEGICRSQADLGKIAEFTNQSHRLAVSTTDLVDSPLIRLIIFGGGYDTLRGEKGSHQPIVVDGHIEGFTRRHERWINAPEYDFNFIVESWVQGIHKELTDQSVPGSQLKAILFNLDQADSGINVFTQDPFEVQVTPNEGSANAADRIPGVKVKEINKKNFENAIKAILQL